MGIEFKKLTCHYEEEPICVNTVSPDFAWVLASDRRRILQQAYRILVAAKAQGFGKGTGDMWDTSWIESNSSVNVLYDGSSLQSDTTYFWSVAIRDTNGNESQWATTHKFTTALLRQSDWNSGLPPILDPQ